MTLFTLSPSKNSICPSDVAHKSQFVRRLQVFSEVALDPPPVCRRSNRNSALFFLPLTLFDWSPPPSLPHLMKIDLFCLDFHSASRLRGFFSAMSAVYFLPVCPSHKRKGHTARPQTTGEGRYKCYWNCLLIFPMLNACPLRRRAVSSVHTELGGFPLLVGVLFIHVFSVQNCAGLLSLLIFTLSHFSHDWFTAYLSEWHLNAQSDPFWLLKLRQFSSAWNFNSATEGFTFSCTAHRKRYSVRGSWQQHRPICGLI